MRRHFAVLLCVSCFVGCGAEPSSLELAEAETSLQPVAAPAAAEEAPSQPRRPFGLRARDGAVSLRAQPGGVVRAHSLAVPDGTRVEFMLGLVGCGMMVVAQDTAVVQGGAFEIPYDPDDAGHFGDVSLFFRVVPADGAACDEHTQVQLAPNVGLPGAADLSTAEPTYAGCWLFR